MQQKYNNSWIHRLNKFLMGQMGCRLGKIRDPETLDPDETEDLGYWIKEPSLLVGVSCCGVSFQQLCFSILENL